MKKIITITLCFLFFAVVSFAQKPKNGTYNNYRFYDTEYQKFFGICKVIIKEDSIKVIAIKDCHQAPNTIICEGVLSKTDDINFWTIRDKTQYSENEDCECLSINFKKKIFYTY